MAARVTPIPNPIPSGEVARVETASETGQKCTDARYPRKSTPAPDYLVSRRFSCLPVGFSSVHPFRRR